MKLHSLLLLFVLPVSADQVYSNVTTNTGFVDLFTINGITEAGDQIALDGAGPSWTLTSALAALYNNSANSGTADITLRIRDFSGNTLGSVVTTSTLFNVPFAANAQTLLNFNGLTGTVNRDLVWTLLVIGGGAGLDLGLEVFTPPTTGTSDDTYAFWNTGSGLAPYSSGFGGDDYFFRLEATPQTSVVPEPGTWALVLVPAVLAVLHRKRFRRGAV